MATISRIITPDGTVLELKDESLTTRVRLLEEGYVQRGGHSKWLDGDLSIGRNLAVGGRADIQGHMEVHHNLRVDGWLDARNIKGVNKGIFADVESLRKAYPDGTCRNGTFAIVGGTLPGELWYVHDGKWTDSGSTAGSLTADMTVYTNDAERLKSDVEELKTDVEGVEKDLVDEKSSRANDTATLQGAISTVATKVDGLEKRVVSLGAANTEEGIKALFAGLPEISDIRLELATEPVVMLYGRNLDGKGLLCTASFEELAEELRPYLETGEQEE